MTNLIDIPTVVGTLVTYFATGGTGAAIEAIKGITVNAALKLAELKDQLLRHPEVEQTVQRYQQNPLDLEMKAQLEAVLTKVLRQHPAFQEQEIVQVQGDIKAGKGGVAVAVVKDSKIELNNTFNK